RQLFRWCCRRADRCCDLEHARTSHHRASSAFWHSAAFMFSFLRRDILQPFTERHILQPECRRARRPAEEMSGSDTAEEGPARAGHYVRAMIAADSQHKSADNSTLVEATMRLGRFR